MQHNCTGEHGRRSKGGKIPHQNPTEASESFQVRWFFLLICKTQIARLRHYLSWGFTTFRFV